MSKLTFSWPLSAMEAFEKEANAALKEMGLIKEGEWANTSDLLQGYMPPGKMALSDVKYFWNYANIQKLAIQHASGEEDIDALVKDFIGKDKTKGKLHRALVEALAEANDPSGLASLRKSWSISDRKEAKARKELKEKLEKEEAEETSGDKPPSSESNSA